MFGRDKRRIKELETQLTRSIAAMQEMQKHAYLADIQKEGRTLKFIFMRRNELEVIETIAPLSINIHQLKEKLIR